MGVSPAFPHRLVILVLAVAAAAGFLPATMHLVHCGPGAPLSFLLRHAVRLVTFLYVLGLSFFLVGVFRFVTAWHLYLLLDIGRMVQMLYRRSTLVAVEWQCDGHGTIFLSR